jgi:hypothetical protein
MNKSALLGLFLVASLIMGTSASMNMFSPATATMSGMTQYDNENNYQQSTYESDRYANSYSNSYNNDKKQQSSYDKSYDKSSYVKNSYGDKYSDHKDKVKKYECKKGPFEGFFTSSVEFCINAKYDDRKNHR